MTYHHIGTLRPVAGDITVVVVENRDDLGPVGTVEKPREIELEPASRSVVEVRSGEQVAFTSRVTIRIKCRVRRGPAGHVAPHIEATLTYNLWWHDRQQLEDRLQYQDRDEDFEMEILTKAGTNEVTYFRSGRLSDHTVDAPQVAGGHVPPWLNVPLGRAIPSTDVSQEGEPSR